MNNPTKASVYHILDDIIDMWCSEEGVENTLEKLIGHGASKEELLFLNFDEVDVDAAISKRRQ